MKAKRFVVCSDNHGNQQDNKACSAFFDFLKDWKPEVRVHAGDGFDVAAFRKGADEAEQSTSLKEDVAVGIEFLRKMKPTHYLRGNHCERIWDGIHHPKAERSALCYLLSREIEAALGFETIPYDKRNGIVRFGHLAILHGYNTGMTAAKRAAEVYGNVLFGHCHYVSHDSVARVERTMGRCIGCLCKLDFPYNRGQLTTLRQAHGFAYGLLYPDGTFRVQQAEEINGRWHLPVDFREYK